MKMVIIPAKRNLQNFMEIPIGNLLRQSNPPLDGRAGLFERHFNDVCRHCLSFLFRYSDLLNLQQA